MAAEKIAEKADEKPIEKVAEKTTENAVEEPVDCSEDALLALRDPFASQMPPRAAVTTESQTKPGATVPSNKDTRKPSPDVVAQPPSASQKPIQPNVEPNSLPPKSAPQLQLTGIIFDTLKPKAIINGTVLGIGDRLEGAVLKTISKGGVEMQYEGGIIKLRMD